MSVAYANETEQSTVSPKEIAHKWFITTMAPHVLFSAEASTDQDVIDETVHRLLDEMANNWRFAKDAKVLLFRASMAGKISATTRGRYDILLPAKKMVRRERSSDEVVAARRRLLKNREERGEDSRGLKDLRHAK